MAVAILLARVHPQSRTPHWQAVTMANPRPKVMTHVMSPDEP